MSSIIVGQTIGQYEIVEKLGSGGMGIVYRAHDLKLDRCVALKFLPPELSRDEEAKSRFEQEARAASTINHPNICAIHDIRETDDGQLFIVMPLYEGRTLKHLISEGELHESEAISIVRQIADGLGAAHDQGIIHRDIKPANIIVTSQGRPIILDFGLAKLAGGVGLTRTGSTMGTTAYMSPEQALGRDVDLRTDIWSLGVVLYEMVCNRPPFQGEYDQAIVYGILNNDPEPVNESASSQVSQVVEKALQKDVAHRYPTMQQFITDLDALRSGNDVVRIPRRSNRPLYVGLIVSAVIALVGAAFLLIPEAERSISSVAVLPLSNLSGDSSQEFLSDGMTDALINELSKIRALKVISRQSVMQFKNSELTLAEIADQLDVEAIITGSVILSGSDIRISAQLREADTEENLWADSFDDEFRNVLVLQSRLARKIANEIRVTVTPEEHARLSSEREIEPEAYEAYLRGHNHLYRLSPADARTAKGYFEQSIALDSTYAQAYAGLAGVWIVLQQIGAVSPGVAGPNILESLNTALRLDSSLADVHYMQALALITVGWNWSGAEAKFRTALDLNPNHGEAHAYFAHLLYILNRFDEGSAHVMKAIELDPRNALFRTAYGVALVFERRYEEAVAQFRLSQKTAPNNGPNFTGLQVSFEGLERFDEALDVVLERYRGQDDHEMIEALLQGFEDGGYRGAMLAEAKMLVRRSEFEFVPLHRVAQLYGRSGDADSAIYWLDRAFEAKEPNLVYLGVNGDWYGLRGDPRYEEILRRMNLDMWLSKSRQSQSTVPKS